MLSALLPGASLAGQTTRVSIDSAGVEGNGDSSSPALSASGRYVAFVSSASNLVPGDDNASWDIFVHDRKKRTTTRVSVDSAGVEGNGQSSNPALSASGRYVAFVSLASNLVPGDDNASVDIFVHDRKKGTTTRVSVDSAGVEGNGGSSNPAFSASGRYVAFDSLASNLVPGDANAVQDIFVHDRKKGETTRVSVDSAAMEGNGDSYSPVLSANGRYVAFDSYSANLVSGDANARGDVFVHDRKKGETTRVSVNSVGLPGNNHSYCAALSASGRFVAFESQASNLVLGNLNAENDLFVYDRKNGETTRVSVDSAGIEGNGGSYLAVLSASGRYVGFVSEASNLVPADASSGQDAFVHDRKKGTTTRVSVDPAGSDANGDSTGTALSANGRYLAFGSVASDLTAGDTNDQSDVFVHDRRSPR